MTTQKINTMENNAQGKNSSTNLIDFIDVADLNSYDENGVFISDREKLWNVQSSQIIEMMNLKVGDTVYIVLAGDDMEFIYRDESDARDNMDEFNWEQWDSLSQEECRGIVENVLAENAADVFHKFFLLSYFIYDDIFLAPHHLGIIRW